MRSNLFVPESLDLKQLVEGGTSSCSDLLLDKLHYVIDHLYLYVVAFKYKWRDFNPLHSQVLAKILGTRDAPKVKKALVECGIVEVAKRNGRECYEPNKRSKRYRFTRKYRGVPFHAVPIKSQGFAARLEEKHSKRIETIIGNDAVRHVVAQSIKKLNYDLESARRFLDKLDFKTVDSQNAYRYAVQCFEDKHWLFADDPQGRLYHNWTQMARTLRRFASYKTTDLFAADVSACQPCLLSLLYEEECEEKGRYVVIVKNNRLYDFLNTRLDQPYDLSDENAKAEFKKLVFGKIFYCSNWAKPTEISQIFACEFPILARLIRKEKRQRHRDLPVGLQKIEADIVVNEVASEFINAHAGEDFCLITVHDCLVTTAEYVEECATRLRVAFRNRLGFEPTIKIKRITALDQSNGFIRDFTPGNDSETDHVLAA